MALRTLLLHEHEDVFATSFRMSQITKVIWMLYSKVEMLISCEYQGA